MDLQTTFYTLGIIFMSLMLLGMIAAVIAIFIIKAKISAIHQRIEEKVRLVTDITHAGAELMTAARKAARK